MFNAIEKLYIRVNKPVISLPKANFVEAKDMKEFDCKFKSKHFDSNKNSIPTVHTTMPSLPLISPPGCHDQLQPWPPSNV